ncbi:unnamed protein product [Vicia faba]|uniref:Uncharacterized protein n=1 Tax=Vicia faba TaxID=3906 RepID=A0AAV0Z9V9_VICFA|nr:unnamed protein product [Vicia faba]
MTSFDITKSSLILRINIEANMTATSQLHKSTTYLSVAIINGDSMGGTGWQMTSPKFLSLIELRQQSCLCICFIFPSYITTYALHLLLNHGVSSLVDGMCNIPRGKYWIQLQLPLKKVQHLIAEVGEILANDTVDKAGLGKNKLTDQSLELFYFLPQAIQDICLKVIHMEMFRLGFTLIKYNASNSDKLESYEDEEYVSDEMDSSDPDLSDSDKGKVPKFEKFRKEHLIKDFKFQWVKIKL